MVIKPLEERTDNECETKRFANIPGSWKTWALKWQNLRLFSQFSECI